MLDQSGIIYVECNWLMFLNFASEKIIILFTHKM